MFLRRKLPDMAYLSVCDMTTAILDQPKTTRTKRTTRSRRCADPVPGPRGQAKMESEPIKTKPVISKHPSPSELLSLSYLS